MIEIKDFQYVFIKDGLVGWVMDDHVRRFNDIIFWETRFETKDAEFCLIRYSDCYWMILE